MHLTKPKDRSAFIDRAISVLSETSDVSIQLPDGLTTQTMAERYDAIIDPPRTSGN